MVGGWERGEELCEGGEGIMGEPLIFMVMVIALKRGLCYSPIILNVMVSRLSRNEAIGIQIYGAPQLSYHFPRSFGEG